MRCHQWRQFWNRYVHEVSSVTSVLHFHAPKLSMQAPHYNWNDQGVVTWKISRDHQMPWLLSIRTKNSESAIKWRPCNVKTIEWAPKFLPTFLAECYFEKISVRKLSVMSSVPFFAVSTSVLPSKDQLVHPWAYSSRKSRNSKLCLLRKVSIQTKVWTVRIQRCFMWEREHITKASTKWLIPFFVVCEGLYHSARVFWLL